MFEGDQQHKTLDKNLKKLTTALEVDRKRVKGKITDSNGQTILNEEISPPLDDANSQIQLLKQQEDNDSFTKEASEKQPELINSIDTSRPLKIGTMKLSNKKSKRKSQIQMQKS